jgi:hypothetical protein
MKTIIHLLFFLLSSVQVIGQVLNHENFVEIELPLPETTAWYQLNQNSQGVKVSIDHGSLKTELVKVPKGDVIYQLPHGTLLAKNRGEFGGKLYYRPNEKSVKRITINGKLDSQLQKPHLPFLNLPFKEEENEVNYFALRGGDINSFFKINDTLYFTSGLAHMGSNTGSLNRLKYSSDDTFFYF